MNVSRSVAELQREHVVLELECIDRMYLNAYIPQLTSENGIAWFFRGHRGHRFASTKLAEITQGFRLCPITGFEPPLAGDSSRGSERQRLHPICNQLKAQNFEIWSRTDGTDTTDAFRQP